MGFDIGQMFTPPTKKGSRSPRPQAQSPVTPQQAMDESLAGVGGRRKKRRQPGKSRSVYTSPLGISAEANIARKRLLGQ